MYLRSSFRRQQLFLGLCQSVRVVSSGILIRNQLITEICSHILRRSLGRFAPTSTPGMAEDYLIARTQIELTGNGEWIRNRATAKNPDLVRSSILATRNSESRQKMKGSHTPKRMSFPGALSQPQCHQFPPDTPPPHIHLVEIHIG